MKKALKIYGISLITALFVAVIIISIHLRFIRKTIEESFLSMQERTCVSILENGYKRYISQTDEEMNKDMEDIYGGPFSDDEKYDQFKCFISNLTEGLNNNTVETEDSDEPLVTDVYRYYDSEMNSLMKENTLLFIRKGGNEKNNARVYYTYEDEAFAEHMQKVINENIDNKSNLRFHIENVYLKEHEFVPAKVSYYIVNDYGGKTEETEISTAAEAEELMKQWGYTTFEIDNEIALGDISSSTGDNDFVLYINKIDDERLGRVEQLIEESLKMKESSDDGRIFIKRKEGLLTSEMFTLKKITPEGGNDSFYAVTYEKKNVLFDLFSYGMMEKGGLIHVVLIVVELIGAIIIALIVATVIYSKSKKSGSTIA